MILDDVRLRCRDFGDDAILAYCDAPMAGAEFWQHARGLCSDLQDLGVSPGSRVALRMTPCGDLYISIIATWLAGAAFVPIDPEEPPRRLAHILSASQAGIVLTSRSGPTRLRADGALHAELSAGRIVSTNGDGKRVRSSASALDDEAYVIFTSGSTGQPKGVSVSHNAIAMYVREALRIYEIPDSGVAFPLQLPLSFDAALTSLLPPLVTRNVAFPISDGVSATRGLAHFLKDAGQPVLVKTTPSQLHLLGDFLAPADVDRLCGAFVVGGEALTYEIIACIRRASGLRIYNEYGPTEATVGCAVYRVGTGDTGSGPVPIGVPHNGAQFVIEPESGAADLADSGELIIVGPCLASGYISNSAADRFSRRSGRRAYRTGDRVRRDGGGQYHFLGREDDQIKINGFRVELGEVEAALRRAGGRASSGRGAGRRRTSRSAGSRDRCEHRRCDVGSRS